MAFPESAVARTVLTLSDKAPHLLTRNGLQKFLFLALYVDKKTIEELLQKLDLPCDEGLAPLIPEDEELRRAAGDYMYLDGFESRSVSIAYEFLESADIIRERRGKAVIADRTKLERIAGEVSGKLAEKIDWLAEAVSSLDEKKLAELADRAFGICGGFETALIFGLKINDVLRWMKRLDARLSPLGELVKYFDRKDGVGEEDLKEGGRCCGGFSESLTRRSWTSS